MTDVTIHDSVHILYNVFSVRYSQSVAELIRTLFAVYIPACYHMCDFDGRQHVFDSKHILM